MQEYNLEEFEQYYTNFFDNIIYSTVDRIEINRYERIYDSFKDVIIGLRILEKDYKNDTKNEGKIIQEYKSNEVKKYYIKFIRNIINDTEDGDLLDFCYRVFNTLIHAFNGLKIIENSYIERAYDELEDPVDEELEELENEFFEELEEIPGSEYMDLFNF